MQKKLNIQAPRGSKFKKKNIVHLKPESMTSPIFCMVLLYLLYNIHGEENSETYFLGDPRKLFRFNVKLKSLES